MVSGTRCPAWSDQQKKWNESRAAAPKSRCPVEHRGEFPYVLRRHIWGLWDNSPWYSMGVKHFFFNFSPIFPCYSMGITHFFSFFHQFSMLFNGNFAFFSFFCQFSMLFNEKFAFFYFFWKFSMLFNGEFAFCQFSMLFNGNLRIEKLQGGTYGRTDGRT